MSDAAIFILFFGAILVVRIVVATVVFIALIPRSVHCPHCDAVTLRVQSKWWNLLMPWFRSSWCIACGWDGMLRHSGELPGSDSYAPPARRERARRG